MQNFAIVLISGQYFTLKNKINRKKHFINWIPQLGFTNNKIKL